MSKQQIKQARAECTGFNITRPAAIQHHVLKTENRLIIEKLGADAAKDDPRFKANVTLMGELNAYPR